MSLQSLMKRDFNKAKRKASEMLQKNKVNKDEIVEEIRKTRENLLKKKPDLKIKKPSDEVTEKEVIVILANRIISGKVK